MKGKFHLIRLVSKVHLYVYHISRGRIGNRIGTVRFLLLTTTGKKSGKKRTVPLTAVPYGRKYILVASFGGSPNHPDWVTNIRHNQAVEIRIGSTLHQCTASIIDTTDPGYAELWERAVAIYGGYNNYKQATARHIPIVVITPYVV